MVQVLDENRTSLLLIDEIFRGTNPIERVAAASRFWPIWPGIIRW